jgi:hypothetical protein
VSEALRRLECSRTALAYFGTARPAAYGLAIEERPEPTRVDCVAISVTLLHGVYVSEDPFQGFRELSADARVGFSILVYDTRKPAVDAAWRAALERDAGRTAWMFFVRPAS